MLGGQALENNHAPESRALADRIVNYSDALAAIVFLGASGLGIAMADPDTRASVNLISSWMIAGNAFLVVLFSGLLILLRPHYVTQRHYALKCNPRPSCVKSAGPLTNPDKY